MFCIIIENAKSTDAIGTMSTEKCSIVYFLRSEFATMNTSIIYFKKVHKSIFIGHLSVSDKSLVNNLCTCIVCVPCSACESNVTMRVLMPARCAPKIWVSASNGKLTTADSSRLDSVSCLRSSCTTLYKNTNTLSVFTYTDRHLQGAYVYTSWMLAAD